ncbi:hypothetical protein [Pseudomonas viridiflava]|uniref:hypothetical protein n=1 Tax=Pseudomonas viridiflava TaxID=33069 RepID=UPI000F03EBC5|nr:hypothetical protein [Pseudomonas viridiflava]
MGWSNGGRFLSKKSRFDGGARKSLASNYTHAQTLPRPQPRDPGSFLWPNEVNEVVAAALSRSSLIDAHEPYEHLLVLTEDTKYYHAYHFLVAPGRSVGEGQRVVMVSDRTVHMRLEVMERCSSLEFTRKLARYAQALPSPRLILCGPCSNRIGTLLLEKVASNLTFRKVELRFRPGSAESALSYATYYDFGYGRYCDARQSGNVDHPDVKAIAQARANIQMTTDFTGAQSIKRPDLMLGRDLTALAMVYVDEELTRIGAPHSAYLPTAI